MDTADVEQHLPLRPLIALVGCIQFHNSLQSYFTSHLSMVAISLANGPQDLARLLTIAGRQKSGLEREDVQRKGILRSDWLEKHQRRRPAVVLYLVLQAKAAGDPSSWAALVAEIGALRVAAQARAVRIMVAVLREREHEGELPADRASMIARQAGIDASSVVSLNPIADKEDLASLGQLIRAQAVAHYAAEAQRRLAKYSGTNLPSVDHNLKAAFKLAALAEARLEWTEAARLYGEAFQYVPQLAVAGAAPLQRFLEIRAVAELINYRLLNVLLRALQNVNAAQKQLEDYLRLLKAPSLHPVPPALTCNHLGWLARSQALAAKSILAAGFSEGTTMLLISASKAAIARRRIAAEIGQQGEGKSTDVVLLPGEYIGQYKRQDNPSAPFGDTEILLPFLRRQEILYAHDIECLGLLEQAHAAAKAAGSARSLARIDVMLGEDLLKAGRIEEAHQHISSAVNSYRRDTWNVPLWNALLLLRECASRAGNEAAHMMTSIEAASLDLSGDNDATRKQVAMAQAAIEQFGKLKRTLEVSIDASTAPWGGVFEGSAGVVRHNDCMRVVIAMRSHAPVQMPLSAAYVLFRGTGEGERVPIANVPEMMQPMTWCTLLADIPSSMTATHLVLHLASDAIVHLSLEAVCGGSKNRTLPPSGWVSPDSIAEYSVSWGGNLRGDVTEHDFVGPSVSITGPKVAFEGERMRVYIDIAAGTAGLTECTLDATATTSGGQKLQQNISIPSLATGEHHVAFVVLEQLSLTVGDVVDVHVSLKFTALGEHMEGEPASTKAIIPVVSPFDVEIKLTGSPHVHCLMPDMSAKTLSQELASLMVLDNGTHGTSILKDIPSHFVLPANQPCIGTVSVRSAAPLPINIIGVEWEANKPLAPSHGMNIELKGAGDACSAVFALAPHQTDQSGSIGTVMIRWSRVSEILGTTPSSPGQSELLAAEKFAVRANTAAPSENMAAALTTAFRPPPAVFVQPLLAAHVRFPFAVEVGDCLNLEIDIHSGSKVGVEAEVNVTETNGFLVSGPRIGNVALIPGGMGRLRFGMVAYVAGPSRLPTVKISAPEMSKTVMDVTANAIVFVSHKMVSSMVV